MLLSRFHFYLAHMEENDYYKKKIRNTGEEATHLRAELYLEKK